MCAFVSYARWPYFTATRQQLLHCNMAVFQPDQMLIIIIIVKWPLVTKYVFSRDASCNTDRSSPVWCDQMSLHLTIRSASSLPSEWMTISTHRFCLSSSETVDYSLATAQERHKGAQLSTVNNLES